MVTHISKAILIIQMLLFLQFCDTVNCKWWGQNFGNRSKLIYSRFLHTFQNDVFAFHVKIL